MGTCIQTQIIVLASAYMWTDDRLGERARARPGEVQMSRLHNLFGQRATVYCGLRQLPTHCADFRDGPKSHVTVSACMRLGRVATPEYESRSKSHLSHNGGGRSTQPADRKVQVHT
ncbi:hypothetical protein PISMIDRAFT_350649 [Pisolithus microcarpus 441]|uniref:Uncharacterized protein n=1 Tax=Pisolithus microcarpus 441 TaxID=765257 RepID=A0A0C9Z3F5_9AGAM|nr:hypothetical protein PISMIDRAFT_350649 [Pisolithus microcarpus 441]